MRSPSPCWLRVFCLLAGPCLGLPVAASDMRSERENDLTLGLKLDYGERFWNRQGDSISRDCSNALILPVRYERGLSYYRTLVVKGGVKHQTCGGSATRLEDIEIGMRGRVDPLSNRYIWEAALQLPASRWTGGDLDRETGSLGVVLGIHVDDRPDPYESFFDPETHTEGRVGYGGGIKLWAEHVPGQAWAYFSWSKLLRNADWRRNIGGWWIYARLEAKHSLLREHRTRADGALDPHDRYWQVSASAHLSTQIKPWQVLTLGISKDLAGRNVSDGSGIAVYYSWNWRD